jgi:hypothetical protein
MAVFSKKTIFVMDQTPRSASKKLMFVFIVVPIEIDISESKTGLPDFLNTIYQNWENHTKLPRHYLMAKKYTKWL